jgi:hypothetical protein
LRETRAIDDLAHFLGLHGSPPLSFVLRDWRCFVFLCLLCPAFFLQ